MRDPNEPSISDHNAPYNEEEYIDENGEEQTRCGCSSCSRRRQKEGRAEYLLDREIDRADFRRDEAKEWAGMKPNDRRK